LFSIRLRRLLFILIIQFYLNFNVMLCTSISSFAFAETGNALLQVKKAVQEATLTGDATALKAARDLAQNVVQQTPHKATALYYLGYAQYSLAVLPGEKASIKQHTDVGIAALEDAIKLEPPFADAHALPRQSVRTQGFWRHHGGHEVRAEILNCNGTRSHAFSSKPAYSHAGRYFNVC
jgi:hypothetical protein